MSLVFPPICFILIFLYCRCDLDFNRLAFLSPEKGMPIGELIKGLFQFEEWFNGIEVGVIFSFVGKSKR